MLKIIFIYSQSRLLAPKTDLKFFNLSTLSLNHTLIPWQDIDLLAKALPQLQDLQLGGNELCQLGQMEFPHLKSLNLEDNLINDWSNEINKLSESLPRYVVSFSYAVIFKLNVINPP